MIDTVLGLPTHPLVVHGVVVLLPLLAVATALLAWLPGRWRTWSVPVFVLDVGALGLAVLAKESGERLEHRITETPQIEAHGELGGTLPYAAMALLLCALVIAAAAHRHRLGHRNGLSHDTNRSGSSGALQVDRRFRLAISLLTTVVAVFTLYWTARAGHSGAVAVWGQTIR